MKINFLFCSDLHITIAKRLKTTAVFEGDNCSFECVLSHELLEAATWFLKDQLVETNGRMVLSSNGRRHKMNIQEAILSDAGDVLFSIKDLSCKTMLFVKGDPSTVDPLPTDPYTQSEIPFIVNVAVWSLLSTHVLHREASEGVQGHAERAGDPGRGRRAEL